MPWKLILFILSIVLVTIFIGFNLENSCDVCLGVYTFEDVPIFMSILLAFALGVLIMFPFTFGHGKKEKKSTPKKTNITSSTETQKAPIYTSSTTSTSSIKTEEKSSLSTEAK